MTTIVDGFVTGVKRALGMEPTPAAVRTSLENKTLRENIAARRAVLEGLEAQLVATRAQSANLDRGPDTEAECRAREADLVAAEKAFAPIEAAYLANPTAETAKAHEDARVTRDSARHAASFARDQHAKAQTAKHNETQALSRRASVLEEQIAKAKADLAQAEKDLTLVPLRIAATPGAAHADVAPLWKEILDSVDTINRNLDAIDARWLLAEKACRDHADLGGSLIRALDPEALAAPVIEQLHDRGYVTERSFRYILQPNPDFRHSPLGDKKSKLELIAELVRVLTGPKATPSRLASERERLRRMRLTASGAPHEIERLEQEELAAAGDLEAMRHIGKHSHAAALEHVPKHMRAAEFKRLSGLRDSRDSFEPVSAAELAAEQSSAPVSRAAPRTPATYSSTVLELPSDAGKVEQVPALPIPSTSGFVLADDDKPKASTRTRKS